MEYIVDCSKEAMDYLCKQDPVLGAWIKAVGPIERGGYGDVFEAVVDNIVNQQISTAAGKTVGAKLRAICGETITPETIFSKTDEEVQSCGLSWRKVGYIKSAAEAALNGRIQYEELHGKTKDEVLSTLIALPGIGEWTVEMLLIFTLGHPDIVSYKDLGIRRGMRYLYALEEGPSKEQFRQYALRYSPYGSVASLYLWKRSAAGL